MFGQFDDLDQLAVGSEAAEGKFRFFETLAISVVEFVAMAMALVDDKSAIEPRGLAADH